MAKIHFREWKLSIQQPEVVICRKVYMTIPKGKVCWWGVFFVEKKYMNKDGVKKSESYYFILTHSSYTGGIYLFFGLVLGDINILLFNSKNDLFNIIPFLFILAAIGEFVRWVRQSKSIQAINQKSASITFFCLLALHIALMILFKL